MFNFLKPQAKENHNLHQDILRQKSRQADLSSHVALGITTVSAIAILSGVGFLYFGKIGETTLTTSSGIVASINLISVQFAKKKNEELQKMLAVLNTEQKT